jgi:predicted dehydrogenase
MHKIAFIGAGFMASEHIKAFSDIPNVELVGIFSRTKSKAESLAREFSIRMVADSIDSLYNQTHADLVIISVPELSVREVAFQSFKFPWLCLIEKPAGYDYSDAQKISEAADALNRKVFVALNRRQYSSTQTVLDDLNTIPEKRIIHVLDQEDTNAALSAGQPPLVVENWMYANSIHVIDYLLVFGRGKVTKVEKIVKWNPVNPFFVHAKIEFDSGDIGIYQAVWNAPGPWSVTIGTTSKRWELRPLETASFQLYGQRGSESVPTHIWDHKFKPGIRKQAEMLVNYLDKKPNVQLPTLHDALEVMKLTKEIYFD